MPDISSPGATEPLDDLFAGTKYSTIRRLAAGGMGEVFLVLHREMGQEFVLKVVHSRLGVNEQLLERMRIEAQTLGRLAHPHIVSVIDFGVTRDGRPFIVMERLIGRTIAAELAQRGALPAPEAIAYVVQLLAALEATHAAGIVHRDIKPDNLFLVKRAGGRLTLKVLDFGIARVLPGYADAAPRPLSVPTDTGLVVGTPRFVSPEGALGKRVDARADLYAAGLILYLLLTGKGPFDHLRGEAQILAAHVNLQPLSPSAALGTKPGSERWPTALDEIVLCALRKNPDTRFQTAAQFRELLQALVEEMRALSSVALAGERRAAGTQRSPTPGSAQAAPREPQAGSSSSTGLPQIPMSIPSLRELLILVAVAAVTAIAASQLVRVILRQ